MQFAFRLAVEIDIMDYFNIACGIILLIDIFINLNTGFYKEG